MNAPKLTHAIAPGPKGGFRPSHDPEFDRE
jgi:hypothetical protein